MDIDIKDKNIIITGGTSGLGFSISKLLELNNNIFVIGNKNSNRVKKKLGGSKIFKADLTNPVKTINIFKQIKKKVKNIDIIICFAGKSKPIKFNKIKSNHWLDSFNHNFITTTNTIESYDKIFNKKKTKIILVSSICASEKLNCSEPYALSKNALNFYTKIVTKKYSLKGIYINTISPGNIFVKNGLWDKKIKKNKRKIFSNIKKNVPLQRFGNIDELMNLINYIVFSKSEFHLGSNFILDGGQSL